MRNDSRLSRMLHVLLHMVRHDGPMTSVMIAQMLGTNPVVVRRTMAGLRDAGYVTSEKGHGGGWKIAANLEKVSLLDIHRAVGGQRIFAIGNEHPNPRLRGRESRQRGVGGCVTRGRGATGGAAGRGQPCGTGAEL